MRERERNLTFRRLTLHYFEKDGMLMVKIPDVPNAWTRLFADKGEIRRLKKYIDRIVVEGAPSE